MVAMQPPKVVHLSVVPGAQRSTYTTSSVTWALKGTRWEPEYCHFPKKSFLTSSGWFSFVLSIANVACTAFHHYSVHATGGNTEFV